MKNIFGIVGSFRKGSLNGMLMAAIKERAEAKGLQLEIADFKDVPLFNQDLLANYPTAVTVVKNKIKSADAVIIATPEYNRSVPGVLKNLIDWTSRPKDDNVWNGKLVATVGATNGITGTIAAQYVLKQSLLCMNVRVVGNPEFYLGMAQEKFDENGTLIDEITKKKIDELLSTLATSRIL